MGENLMATLLTILLLTNIYKTKTKGKNNEQYNQIRGTDSDC